MCMKFVSFLRCFCSLFCYVTRHADIVIRITLFRIVYIRMTSPNLTSRVNEAIVNYQKKLSTMSFMRYHGWYKRYYFLENLTGTENDLNHVLSSFVDSEHEIVNFRDSRYIGMSDIKSVFKQGLGNFHIFSLNVQSINVKFDNLFPVINNLSPSDLHFGAICLQETWLGSNADISMFHIPGYELIHQGFRCTQHGVYINEKYSYKRRNLYDKSDVWEGLFIDVNGHNLSKTLTIGNMYRPPHDNYNNKSLKIHWRNISNYRYHTKRK